MTVRNSRTDLLGPDANCLFRRAADENLSIVTRRVSEDRSSLTRRVGIFPSAARLLGTAPLLFVVPPLGGYSKVGDSA